MENDELVDAFLGELVRRFHTETAEEQFQMMAVVFPKLRAVLHDLHDEYERFHPDYPDWEDQGVPVG